LYLSYAHGWFDKAAADRAYEAVAGIGKRESSLRNHRDNADLLYHLYFGDMDRAANAARRAAKRARTSDSDFARTVVCGNAAVALHMAGCFADALSAQATALEAARKAGIQALVLQFSAMMARIYWDNGDLEAAAYWDEICDSTPAASRSYERTPTYLSNKIEMSLLRGDVESARIWQERSQQGYAELESPHSRLIARSYELLIERTSRNSTMVDDSSLDELMVLHDVGKRYLCHDTFMEALWYALCERGQADRASNLASAYVRSFRRERHPLMPGLAKILAGVNS
jgi:ATP/maltotriose-dependent transcriptional regulator MalT